MKGNDMKGRVVLVVGGTSGLGFSAARALIDAGASLVITGRHPEKANEAARLLGPRCLSVPGDAALPTSSLEAVTAAVERYGRLDALYHVAGGSGRSHGDGRLHEVTEDAVEHTLALNLKSLIYSNRAALRQFLLQGDGGVILNMSSVLAFSPSPDHFASHVYTAAKSAAIGFSKSLAADYARENIRCNVIAPALVASPMSQRAAGDSVIMDFIRYKQPLDGGRIGQPEDLDEAALFLLSPASRFVTGQVLAVDGGWSVSEGHPRPPRAE